MSDTQPSKAPTQEEIKTPEEERFKDGDKPTEIGGRPKEKGLEPTRYGDWEKNGIAYDF